MHDPLLFSLYYTCPLFELIRSHLPDMHCYADNTQVYLSFKPNSISSEDSAFSAIQSCISAIRSWLLTCKLLINDTKSEFLIMGTRQQISKIQTDSISVGESRISSSKEVQNLGTWLDNTFSMSTQISKVASSCFFWIYNIQRIRKYLSRRVCETFLNALSTSCLYESNSLLYGSHSSLVARLQRVLNSAARPIYNVSRSFSLLLFLSTSTGCLLTSHFPDYITPDYISQLKQVKTSNRTLRSFKAILLEDPTIKSSKTQGDRVFTLAAPVEWNLPPCIRNAPLLPFFKKLLTTHLSRIAHPTIT